MSTSIAYPAVQLPHDPLSPLDSTQEPTAEAVRLLRQELYENARALPSELAGGNHGHLGLIMPAADYLALAGHPYHLPVRPDIPDYLGAEDEAERAEWAALYKVDTRLYNEALGLNLQLKNLLLKAVPRTYIAILADVVHGFADVTIQDLLQYLLETYGAIYPEDLEKNMQRLKAPWDPATPLITVFTTGNECRQFAIEGGDPISDPAYIRILLETFTKSGVFTSDIRDWEKRPRTEHTVLNLTLHFNSANRLRRRSDDSLKGALSANSAITNGATPKGWTYCWSHGLCTHTSATCPDTATNHNKAATLDNLMGGCTQFQRPPDYKPIFRYASQRNRTDDKDKANKARDEKKKASAKAAAAKITANAEAIATAVAKAMAAQAATH